MKEGNNLKAVEQRIDTAIQALKEGRGILSLDHKSRRQHREV